MVVYELFEVTAASPEDAVEKVQEDSSHKKSVVVAAASLRELAHPVHLMDAETKFGMIGQGKEKSAASED
jgi:hypothetical protein